MKSVIFISVDPLLCKLAELAGSQQIGKYPQMVSEIFTDICHTDHYFHTGT